MQNNSVPMTQDLVKQLTTIQRVDDFFDDGSAQYSSDIQLDEGQSILLEATHCNAGGPGHMQVRGEWHWGPQVQDGPSHTQQLIGCSGRHRVRRAGRGEGLLLLLLLLLFAGSRVCPRTG